MASVEAGAADPASDAASPGVEREFASVRRPRRALTSEQPTELRPVASHHVDEAVDAPAPLEDDLAAVGRPMRVVAVANEASLLLAREIDHPYVRGVATRERQPSTVWRPAWRKAVPDNAALP